MQLLIFLVHFHVLLNLSVPFQIKQNHNHMQIFISIPEKKKLKMKNQVSFYANFCLVGLMLWKFSS